MAIIEEGKAAKRSDSLLDYIAAQKARHDEQIASLDWRIGYAYVVIQQLAQTCSEEQREILLDLCGALHDGIPDERN